MLHERVEFRRHLSHGFAFTLEGAEHMSFSDMSAISGGHGGLSIGYRMERADGQMRGAGARCPHTFRTIPPRCGNHSARRGR
jgi:hypothetical protein